MATRRKAKAPVVANKSYSPPRRGLPPHGAMPVGDVTQKRYRPSFLGVTRRGSK